MIALKALTKKVGMNVFSISAGKVIPEAVLKSFSSKDLVDMKKRNMIVDDKKTYDSIIKAEKDKDDEAIKKGEATRKKLIASRNPKTVTIEEKKATK